MNDPASSSEQGELVLWGVGTARTFRAHWALCELGLSYRIEAIRARTGETQTAAYTAMHSGQKIPLLQDGSLALSESTAIVTYLGENFRGGGCVLTPGDPLMRARYFEWMAFISTELDATSLYVLRRHVYLRDIYGDAPQANQVAREYFSRMIEAAATRFPDGQRYLLGEAFSGADILMVSCLDWAKRYELALPARFEAYRADVAQRAAYKTAFDANAFA